MLTRTLPLNSFDDLGLSADVLTAIHALGYETPTPIQAEAIPIVLEGKDVLGVAQTGTGKTAAFSLPMIHRLSQDRYSGQFQPIRGLILTPTRELAIQIEENILEYTKHVKLHTATIFGGVNQKSQVQKLRRGVDIVVATPGRLIDLQEQGHVNLKHLQYFVLDEADTMMDMGFIHDLRRIIKHIPKERQSLFFSATMPPNILEFANTMLRNPVRVEVARESTAAETVDQQMMFVMQAEKRDLLVHLLQKPEVETALVFMRTKYGADKVVKYLTKNKLNAAAIHGNKTQPQRERAMQGFRKGTITILVATDIAARGIDVSGVSHVINFEIPNISETYVHRIGRTGRAGASGVAWSFVNEADERKFMSDIQQLMKREVPLITDHPWHLAKPALDLDINKPGQRPQAPGSGGSKKKKKKPFNHGKPRQGGAGKSGGGSGNRFRSDRDGGSAPRREGGGGQSDRRGGSGGGQSDSGRSYRGNGKSSGGNSGNNSGNNSGGNSGNRGGQNDSRYSRR